MFQALAEAVGSSCGGNRNPTFWKLPAQPAPSACSATQSLPRQTEEASSRPGSPHLTRTFAAVCIKFCPQVSE